MKKQAHDILGVKSDATPDEIKKAYRKKSKAVHPDSGGSAEAFNQLQMAYKEMNGEEANTSSNPLALFAQMFEVLLQQHGENLVYQDIPAVLRHMLKSEMQNIAQQKAGMSKHVRMYKRLLACCTTDSVIKSVLQQKVRDLANNIKAAERAIKELEAALPFADTIGFVPETNAQPAESIFTFRHPFMVNPGV